MGTKANPGKYDCYANAEPDEPLFILLARDKHAPTLVWLWGVLRELDGESPEKVQEAHESCLAMLRYAAAKGIQVSGLSESIFAGLLELVRGFNWAIKKAGCNPENSSSTVEDVRRILLQMKAEGVG